VLTCAPSVCAYVQTVHTQCDENQMGLVHMLFLEGGVLTFPLGSQTS
jgi:hypothetical protein